ncbi:hypothetical protein FOA52_001966 [Chlamydomonas sp. UWO 241]|nr:hypothetical protein FOA52_001966 [Chlamydomonas sp. UWO 241]
MQRLTPPVEFLPKKLREATRVKPAEPTTRGAQHASAPALDSALRPDGYGASSEVVAHEGQPCSGATAYEASTSGAEPDSEGAAAPEVGSPSTSKAAARSRLGVAANKTHDNGTTGWMHLGQGAYVGYWPSALSPDDAARLMVEIEQGAVWEVGTYTYAGTVTETPRPMAELPALAEARRGVEGAAGLPPGAFNSVLLNLYRDGRDHVGWHADDEQLYGKDPIIGSLSLGESREFVLRRKDDHATKHSYTLSPGDVLLMRGAMQRHWHHCIMKRPTAALSPRVNLTFRLVERAESWKTRARSQAQAPPLAKGAAPPGS